MILNERQYKASRASIARFQEQMTAPADAGVELGDQKRQLVTAAYASQIEDIERELAEYDALRDGRVRFDRITSLEDLRLALIRARIAKGWTQLQLAEAMKVSEQQVQRDEMNRYARVGVDRLQSIADEVGLTFAGSAAFPSRHELPEALESHESWRKPLLLLILQGVKQRHGRAVAGHLEMQKLALLVDEGVRAAVSWKVFRFEPYLYGAYDPQLEDDLDFLVQYDFVRRHVRGRGSDPYRAEPDRIVDIEPGPKAQTWIDTFLKDERIGSPETKHRVAEAVQSVVEAFGDAGREELLRHTYTQFEQLASRSTIKDQVARSKKRAGGR